MNFITNNLCLPGQCAECGVGFELKTSHGGARSGAEKGKMMERRGHGLCAQRDVAGRNKKVYHSSDFDVLSKRNQKESFFLNRLDRLLL